MVQSSSSVFPLDRALRIDRICDSFESAWLSGSRPSLSEVLHGVDELDRVALFRELLPIDAFHRRRTGEELVVEDYATLVSGLDVTVIEQLIRSTQLEGERFRLAEDEKSSKNLDLPGYEILGEVGRGAMGVVVKARHIKLGRTVALKMVISGRHASLEELRRFHDEAATIAKIQHPHIVQIFEFGVYDDQPFIALEYIDGPTMAQKFAGVPQPPRDAARLIETLARAIHHAHGMGIIHRDLKPANVILTRDGVPKITDFGLAKQPGADQNATATGILLGTPQYMAPEQASNAKQLLGPATDIHALGIMLYELLTGRPPYQAPNLAELLPMILRSEPTPPRLIKHGTPKDLETICLKCLDKAPAARYSSAAELADDLHHYLSDQPIQARRTGSVEKTWRWCKRNPWIATTTVALAIVLIGVSVGSVIAASWFKALSDQSQQYAQGTADAKLKTERNERETRYQLARSLINEARMLRRSQRVGDPTEAFVKVKKAQDMLRDLRSIQFPVLAQDWNDLCNEAASALLVHDLVTVKRWPRHDSAIPAIATDTIHQRYVRMSEGTNEAVLCHYGSDDAVQRIEAPAGTEFVYGEFSAQGNRLALWSQPDNRFHLFDTSDLVKFIRADRAMGQWRGFSCDGELYAITEPDETATIIRVANGETTWKTDLGSAGFPFPFHPIQPWIALVRGETISVVDFEHDRIVWQKSMPRPVRNIAWSFRGEWLAISGPDRMLQPLSAANGTSLCPEIAQVDSDGLFPIPVSQVGMLASSDWSGGLQFFNVHTGRLELKAALRLCDWPRANAPDGTLSLAYDQSDYVSIRSRGSRLTEFATNGTTYVALSRSGKLLVAYTDPHGAFMYSLPTGEWLATLPPAWGDLPLGFEPNDQAFFMYGKGQLNRIPLTRTPDQPSRLKLGPAQLIVPDAARDTWGMDDASRVIASPKNSASNVIYRRPPGNETWESVFMPKQNDVRHVAISPDGRWFVAGSHVRGKIAVYDAHNGSHVKDLTQGVGGRGKFSPDGRYFAAGMFDGSGELFEVGTWHSRGRLPGHCAAFSHDGKTVAANDGTSTIGFFDVESLRKTGQLEIRDQVRVFPLMMTPQQDGLIALAADNRRLLYFDLAGIRQDLVAMELDPSFLPVPRAANDAADEITTVEILEEQPSSQ